MVAAYELAGRVLQEKVAEREFPPQEDDIPL